MATKDDIVIGSRWRAVGSVALPFAAERGNIVEVRPHAEADRVPGRPDCVVLLWQDGTCRSFSDPDLFLLEFDPCGNAPQFHPKHDPYSAGPNGETAGYLAGLTGNRWL